MLEVLAQKRSVARVRCAISASQKGAVGAGACITGWASIELAERFC
jgi:hypothetical protein